jgi:hypothetical protein
MNELKHENVCTLWLKFFEMPINPCLRQDAHVFVGLRTRFAVSQVCGSKDDLTKRPDGLNTEVAIDPSICANVNLTNSQVAAVGEAGLSYILSGPAELVWLLRLQIIPLLIGF